MKVKDKKNNLVISGLVLLLIIIIFGQQGNTFTGAVDIGVAEKPTKDELEMVLREGYTMINGENGALEYVKGQIKKQQKDIEYANKYQFGLGNRVRLAAIKILQEIKTLMESINKDIIELYNLLRKIGNDQNKLAANDGKIKDLIKSINSDLKKIDIELNKFNDDIFFISIPLASSKKDLIKNERSALALAQQKVGDIRERLKNFNDGIQLMQMPMPMPRPMPQDSDVDMPPAPDNQPASPQLPIRKLDSSGWQRRQTIVYPGTLYLARNFDKSFWNKESQQLYLIIEKIKREYSKKGIEIAFTIFEIPKRPQKITRGDYYYFYILPYESPTGKYPTLVAPDNKRYVNPTEQQIRTIIERELRDN